MTETISYMGEVIDVCTTCEYSIDHCKCDPDDD